MLAPVMTPPCGTQQLRFVGDRAVFHLSHPQPGKPGWRAFLRTNLTRGARAREETLALLGQQEGGLKLHAGASWRDIPLQETEGGWALDLALTEAGNFQAKAYCVDPEGIQHWPQGEDLALCIHPDRLRTANTIYCAFPRMCGGAARHQRPDLAEAIRGLDEAGYTVIPPSGRLRDLTAVVPHIMDDLGCRILHLLPVGPVPTTFARMGRFGSPYAQLDLTAIDPALVELDRRTTAEEQFRELTRAVHGRGGQVLLDILVNHTGWGSRLLEYRPDWFRRNPDGSFHSPGAWGTTWEDLVELDHGSPDLWDAVARALLTWCERGVDGFRCDAGYLVPLPAWQYITAKVHQVFPETIFLLEGLGGAWEATETLLVRGGMQWAYSELFQNFQPRETAHYLDHCFRQSHRSGLLVHYSETHDNQRLAARGAAWSLLRNRLCALSSQCGGYAFTAGVEWLATEKVDVHEARDLAWGAQPNLVPQLAALNRLISDHPCFFDGAMVQRLSADDAPVLALLRTSAEGLDQVWVLVNLDPDAAQVGRIAAASWMGLGEACVDLLGQDLPPLRRLPEGDLELLLSPGASFCLAAQPQPRGLSGDAYRTLRAQAAWALHCLAEHHPVEALGPADWRTLAGRVARDPAAFLAALPHLKPVDRDLIAALDEALATPAFPQVTRWQLTDARRGSVVAPGHWLLLQAETPFAATLRMAKDLDQHLYSVPVKDGFMAAFPPRKGRQGKAVLQVQLQGAKADVIEASLHFLPETPAASSCLGDGVILLTNGRGAMARLQADLGAIASKYDCLLGANLHPSVPSDRHVLVKRLRAWVHADGFITALDGANLVSVEPGPPARWRFLANAGDGRRVEIGLEAHMPPGENAVLLRWTRPDDSGADTNLPARCQVRLTVRLDLEDRSFHGETRLDADLEAHWQRATNLLPGSAGFCFCPAAARRLEVRCESGTYHPQPEVCRGIAHPLEASRGLAASGDAWSPGWFDLPLAPGGEVPMDLWAGTKARDRTVILPSSPQGEVLELEARLQKALQAFLARRNEGLTVIAGYPWFLDWGRDTLIVCRGLLASGQAEAAGRILRTFATLEECGTLPNMLGAENTADRDTSDAPLWLAVACEEAAEHLGTGFWRAKAGERTVAEVLTSLGHHLRLGAPNGVRMDPASALLWSPAHFSWMDTRYPMGSPREGYPVEIQALWIRLLRLLARLGAASEGEPWSTTAARATQSLDAFWLEERGWFADVLLAGKGVSAEAAIPADHLRPNQLLLVSLGLLKGERARRAVGACARYLLVPGGLRSLAPLPVTVPLPIPAPSGGTLNDPLHPYWGRYEGDEDTRRKPAYHNGTAWVWLLPLLCEALSLAWEGDSAARATARAWLGTVEPLLDQGCLGQLPELLDGDAPHAPRGCDAQAWSVSEALRVWVRLR